jgi:hypothetical protein
MTTSTRRLLALPAFLTALAALWFLPPLLLPHPVTNQHIELSDLGLLVLLSALGGSLLALAIGRLRDRGPGGIIGLGAFWLGMGPVAVLAFLAVGNPSDDAFGPLLLMPVLTVPAGAIILGTGLRRRHRGLRGPAWAAVARGLLAAAGVGAWTLARGSAEWKLAPYGLDVMVLEALAAATVLGIGAAEPRIG